MNKQSVTTAVKIRDGVVVRTGKGSIYQPVTHFQGGSVKWYGDKVKKQFINTVTRGEGGTSALFRSLPKR